MLDQEFENNQDSTSASQNPEGSVPQEGAGAADEVGSSTVNWTTATPIVAESGRQSRQEEQSTSAGQGVFSGNGQPSVGDEAQATDAGTTRGTFSQGTPISPIPEEPAQKSKTKKAKKHKEKKQKEKKPTGIVKRAF
ncbi:MAG: hypothetical protein LUH19_02220, partial [Lachnospiraceae bacterium]|nr:hypothetical protein [Lachnospiraceae bacterium]